MKILVTGGAGFIGSHTIRLLLKKGYSVVCVDNFNNYYSPLIKENNIKDFIKHKNFKLYREDIVDYDVMRHVFKIEKVDKICHLAARAGVRASIENPFLYEQVNVRGTLNLLELTKVYRIKNFILASSSSVYGNSVKVPFSETDNINSPISPYAATKRSAELLAYTYHHLYGIHCTVLRFFTVYGPSGRPDMAPFLFVDSIYKGKKIKKFGDGSSKRDYTYIGDIVSGIISALETDLAYEIINLGNNKPVDLNYFIGLVEKLLNKKAIIDRYPKQQGDANVTFANINKAKKMLHYVPKTSIQEGMKKFITWYLKNIL